MAQMAVFEVIKELINLLVLFEIAEEVRKKRVRVKSKEK